MNVSTKKAIKTDCQDFLIRELIKTCKKQERLITETLELIRGYEEQIQRLNDEHIKELLHEKRM